MINTNKLDCPRLMQFLYLAADRVRPLAFLLRTGLQYLPAESVGSRCKDRCSAFFGFFNRRPTAKLGVPVRSLLKLIQTDMD